MRLSFYHISANHLLFLSWLYKTTIECADSRYHLCSLSVVFKKRDQISLTEIRTVVKEIKELLHYVPAYHFTFTQDHNVRQGGACTISLLCVLLPCTCSQNHLQVRFAPVHLFLSLAKMLSFFEILFFFFFWLFHLFSKTTNLWLRNTKITL